MQKWFSSLVAVCCSTAAAVAADMPVPVVPVPLVPALWSGLYLGVHIGGGFGQSGFSDPAGSSIYGGTVHTPLAMGGGQIGYNWQVPNARWVFGAEADVSGLSGSGTNTCFASSGYFISANCRVRPDTMASLTGRVGYASGPQARTLLFVKGGAAWLDQKLDASNLTGPPTSLADIRWGWTVGAGIEQALSPAWSLKAEYDYANFGSAAMTTPTSFVQTAYPFTYAPTPSVLSNVSQSSQAFKLGLNLKLGPSAYAHWDDDAAPLALRGGVAVPDAEIEVGARIWGSGSRYQKDLGGTTDTSQQNYLVSRLTYDTTAASGEIFGRVDTATNFFLKGFVGGGGTTGGKMNDEDWLAFNESVPYSNTSSSVKGTLAYGTFDVGYNFLRGRTYKVGGFVGYNYLRENKSAYGCTQIANPNSDCVPAISGDILAITENGQWNSARLGINCVFALTRAWTFTADAAYLPYARYSGADTHWLRTDASDLVSPEGSTGQGVQLEAVLSYALTNSFNIGAGGRYWAMWTTNNSYTNIFGSSCPCQTMPSRTERYGAFLQASYNIGVIR